MMHDKRETRGVTSTGVMELVPRTLDDSMGAMSSQNTYVSEMAKSTCSPEAWRPRRPRLVR